MLTRCCSSKIRTVSASPRLKVSRCTKCGNLWGEHPNRAEGLPWEHTQGLDEFAGALRSRRILQAEAIVKLIRRFEATEPLLDYGAGQGVFLSAALAAGIDAFGCDLNVDAPLGTAPKDRFIQLDAPWQVPEGSWRTIVMLDVLEHHPDPVSFMSQLKTDLLVLKLPTATGPSARIARLAARAGRAGLLEQLFQVGDPSPHQWLPTRRGTVRLAELGGWRRIHRVSLVEVGRELPNRMRAAPRQRAARVVLTIAGTILGAIGPLWSDAELAFFRRGETS